MVVPPDFSLLWDEPRMEHLINLKRGLVAFSHLQRAGLAAIPHLFWHRSVDLMRHVSWLGRNPGVRMIAVNLQDCKQRREKMLYFAGLSVLSRQFGTRLRVLVAGVQGANDLRLLAKTLGTFHLVNFQAYMPAFYRRRLLAGPQGIQRRHEPDRSARNLFEINCRAQEDFLSALQDSGTSEDRHR
jgi:hypothetical protein